MGTFYGRAELGEGIFRVSMVEWTFFIGEWVWLEEYFGWVELGRQFLSVGWDKWRYVLGEGGWTFFMGEWGVGVGEG